MMQLAPEQSITSETQLADRGLPLVIEFTSSRVRTRPLATRAGGIEYTGGRLPVRAVDIDAHPDLRRRFQINLLPTFVGPHSRRELAGALRRALDPSTVLISEPPRARGVWNAFTMQLWGFTSS